MTEKKAILMVSFGTSYNDTREKTIGALERDVAAEFPDWEVRRAFTSRMIIEKILRRDGERIDYITDALDRLAQDGFERVVVQPTHIMNGIEYDDIVNAVMDRAPSFGSIVVGAPLLTTIDDYGNAVEVIRSELLPYARNIAGDDAGLVLMGHGTIHIANAAYSQMQFKLAVSAGTEQVFVTTVEGFPEYSDTLKIMRGKGISKIAIMPFMLVAGDHANNDMAGDDEDSMKNVFSAAGYDVVPIVKGLGEFPGIRKLFIDHIRSAME